MNPAAQKPPRAKTRAIGIALVLGTYLLLEWLFAFMSQAEGLVNPAGRPNLEVVALGIAYLGVRLVVRGILPSAVALLIAGVVERRWRARRARKAARALARVA
jgi:hypothetical protein